MRATLCGRRLQALLVTAALAASLIAAGAGTTASAAPASAASGGPAAASLWPRFSTPREVLVANATTLSNDDLLTATTLQGIYNAAQQPSRLYLIQRNTDQFWLDQVPRSIRVVNLPPPPQGDLVRQLLHRFRRFIKGAIVTDPSNADTINLATTMAGIDHAVVIDPSQEQLAASLGIPVIYSFDTPAFTADSVAATYEWGVQNLLPLTSTRLVVMLPPSNGGDIRDYTVATKAFIFYLTSTDSSEEPVMNTILAHTPANTPVMGYIPDEGPDVADLSSLGHFLNASDDLSNESVWASLPSPAFLRQRTQAEPLAVQPGTVYVAFMVSDGDNAQYMQGTMALNWQGPDLGAVPEGWTVAPGTVDFDPAMLEYYSSHVPADSELDAGPSGIGYATDMSGADLTQFAQLSAQFMRRDDLRTVDDWEAPSDLAAYAQASGVPSISQDAPVAEEQLGDTVAFGQTSGYTDPAQNLFCTVYQQSGDEQSAQPVFLEPLVDAWNLNPQAVLQIAQSLAAAAQAQGEHIVFTTPTELALTMKRYYAGQERQLPAANAQSMTGAQVLAEPLVSPSFPASPAQASGPNLVANPSGAAGTAGWYTAGGNLTATTYQGQPALQWTSDVTSEQSWAHTYPDVTDGDTYTFSVQVAGSGQVFMDVYNGSLDETTTAVNLTSSYQTLTWTETIPAGAPGGQMGSAPQLQVRESGAGPVSVYISDASVVASTSPC